MNKFIAASILIVCIAFAVGGCRKQRITADPSARLEFSTDTVHFDTVFTTLGSTTQLVKIYNRNNDAVIIEDVQLVGGAASNFRLNLNGVPGSAFSDLTLRGGDSLWMFVEVTVDPGNQNTPFVIEDLVQFKTNGNEQLVTLVAWGQDAIFHGRPGNLTVLDCNEVWSSEKPHVVYGIVAVDEGCALTITAGTQVHCHARSGIYVFKGKIDVFGQKDNEVVFQGTRLEPQFSEVPGQWGIELAFQFEGNFGVETATVARGGLWLMESTGSTVNYAIFKNGNIGIQVDTLGSTSTDALTLSNTIVTNMGVIGILGQGASISGQNNLVTNCGQSCAAFTIGGSYRFAYSTFANYWSGSVRQAPAMVLNNYYLDFNDNLQVRPLTNTWFHNCIVWGNNAGLSNFNEFFVDIENEQAQDYRFEHCAVATTIDLSDENRFSSIINGATPPFISAAAGNFRLSPNAASIWSGGFIQGDTWSPVTDLDLIPRIFPGWKGCYEVQ